MWYQIRDYQDMDYSSVRKLYSAGFREHEGAVHVLILKQHWVQTVLLGLLILFLHLFDSLLASVPCLGGVLLAGSFAVSCLFEQRVQLRLSEDLQDIRASYMHPDQISCFCVAESKGSLVGIVAILPRVTEPGGMGFETHLSEKGLSAARPGQSTLLDHLVVCCQPRSTESSVIHLCHAVRCS